MHPKNLHSTTYDFKELQIALPELKAFVFTNEHREESIDFSNPNAVTALNKALLKTHYNVQEWQLPEGYLCPPIPGRANYIHHIADLMDVEKPIKGLDIGVGANCIYPLLGASIYKWQMTGTDIDQTAITFAQKNAQAFPDHITIIHQPDNAHLFQGIIKEGDYYDFTICNPPFYASAEAARKANTRKNTNLKINSRTRNFAGQAHELWCNGGEALFIKRLIKQSLLFKNQVGWFTCLVSKKEHLPKLNKQLDKAKATHQTIPMTQGNKKSRCIAWRFD